MTVIYECVLDSHIKHALIMISQCSHIRLLSMLSLYIEVFTLIQNLYEIELNLIL